MSTSARTSGHCASSATGPSVAPTAPTVRSTIAAAADRGDTGRRAGANAPTASSADPTSMPVSSTIPRDPEPGEIASMAVVAALVTAISDSPAAIARRSSRGPSYQLPTTIAVASRPVSAAAVSTATCSDGAG
jgi:hypothetical protein